MAQLSRRNFVKSLGVGALGYQMFASRPAAWAARQAANTALAFYRFKLGDFQMTVIQDGVVVSFAPDLFAIDQEPGTVAAEMEANNLPVPELVPTTLNALLVETGDRTVLVDTGIGAISFSPDGPPPGGNLLATLELLGIGAESVTDVLLTHHHPDHIAIISDMQTPTFTNATYHVSQAEYDFLTSGIVTGNEVVDGFIQLANGLLTPISDADQLALFGDEAEPIPGFQAIPAPGHTPGHTAVRINSNGEELFAIVDTVGISYINFPHPDWRFFLDADHEQAIETRKTIYGIAADEQLRVIGYHLPFPGIGVVSRDGDAFRFMATL